MRTFALAICALGAAAWNAEDYAAYQNYNAHAYEPIGEVELQEQELPIAYQPALTESTEVETVTDRVIWNKLGKFNGLEYYTHSHHGEDADDTHPTKDHLYPEEHGHYREIEYEERRPVIVNQERKIYHVTPKRYIRSYDEPAEEEAEYARDILFPTRKPNTLKTAKQLKAFARFEEDDFGDGAQDKAWLVVEDDD